MEIAVTQIIADRELMFSDLCQHRPDGMPKRVPTYASYADLRYRRDVPKAEVHIVDGGHFALDTAADEIAALVRGFVGSSR